jgi:hypothetical protein
LDYDATPVEKMAPRKDEPPDYPARIPEMACD